MIAFTFDTRFPSTAGICAPAFNCKILFPVTPTSTFKVPVEVNVPGTNPVPD